METQENFAPYAPLENVLRVLIKARGGAAHGLIDTPFLMQLGINESMAPRAIRALQFLGFVQQDGNGTPLLDEYVQASDEEAPLVLRQAVEQAYASIFRAVDPTVDPRPKVFTAFRMMKPRGQWDRMVTLFLGLCREAGLDVKDAPAARPGRIDTVRETRPKTVKIRPAPGPVSAVSTHYVSEYLGLRHRMASPGLDPSLTTFIEKLEGIQSVGDLDAWYAAFKAVFGYVLATKPKPQSEPESPKLDEDQAVT